MAVFDRPSSSNRQTKIPILSCLPKYATLACYLGYLGLTRQNPLNPSPGQSSRGKASSSRNSCSPVSHRTVRPYVAVILSYSSILRNCCPSLLIATLWYWTLESRVLLLVLGTVEPRAPTSLTCR